jgi:hypothetical protein
MEETVHQVGYQQNYTKMHGQKNDIKKYWQNILQELFVFTFDLERNNNFIFRINSNLK